MTPQEWWHIYEAKHGIKTKRYGKLSQDEADELLDMLKKAKEDRNASRRN